VPTFGHFTRRLENGAGAIASLKAGNTPGNNTKTLWLPFPDRQVPTEYGRIGVRSITRDKDFPMRQTGTVKFFNSSKGFGFITPQGGSKDVFVHVSALEAAGISHLTDGQQVSFEVEPDKMGKGPKAVKLQLV
jgi:CspA family cold shock protein